MHSYVQHNLKIEFLTMIINLITLNITNTITNTHDSKKYIHIKLKLKNHCYLSVYCRYNSSTSNQILIFSEVEKKSEPVNFVQ